MSEFGTDVTTTRLVVIVNLPLEVSKFSKLLTVLGELDPKAQIQTKPEKRFVEVTGWLIETSADT